MPEAAQLDGERDVGMCALGAGMDAGIGAAGAFDADGGAEHRRQRVFDHILNRSRVRLRLPAGVARAEVLKRQENAHGRCYLTLSMCEIVASESRHALSFFA